MLRRYFVTAAIGLLTTACVSVGGSGAGSTEDTSPKARTLTVTVSAAANINPGPDGRAAPLPLQVYVLRSTGAFQSTDYFGLKSGLSGEQVDSRSISIRPGETQTLTLNSGTDGAYIGVAAGYRNIDSASWRSTTSIGESDKYHISAGRSSVSISAR